jgi:DNA repair photolyase
MVLNRQKGNMYGFVSHTWNAIRGECPHWCSYCYMHGLWKGEVKLDEKELKTDLGRNNFIFVGSSTDMWAESIPADWILKVIRHCRNYPENTYLFQSKNPKRFIKFRDELATLNCIIGTTIETNRKNNFSNAPSVQERSDAMTIKGFKKMVTIEPIMDFDVTSFILEIKKINPEWVNIGADSKNHNLPEPTTFKVENLVRELKKFTKVNIKDNLSRILNKGEQYEKSTLNLL